MLYRIARPEKDGGNHERVLMVRGGSFPFVRGVFYDIEFDEKADARLLHQLRADGYEVTDPPAPAPVKPPEPKKEGV